MSRWHWRIVALILLATPIAITYDLFWVPKDVSQARIAFETLKSSYFSKKETWDERKKELTDLEDAPVEILLAHLNDHMELSAPHFSDVAITPIGEKHLLLSKKEKNRLPLKIILSLEIELREEDGHLKPQLISLRRGSRELPCDLAWVYFGEELEILRCFDKIN